MNRQGFSVADIGEVTEELEVVDELTASLRDRL